MRLGGLGDHGGQRRLLQLQVILAGPPHRPQDIAAAVSLIADQGGILAQRLLPGQLVDHLGADQLYRRQRRAKLMRRRRDHAAQIGQLLLARQCHLRRKQRIRHGADFAGYAP